MRRQDIQLIALAKSGDVAATLDVGRRYLLGTDGFPRHLPTGLDYLGSAATRGQLAAAVLIAQSLELQDILSLDQLPALQRAAEGDEFAALLKLGAWLIAKSPDSGEGLAMLERASELRDQPESFQAVMHLRGQSPLRRVNALRVLHGQGRLDCHVIASLAVQESLKGDDMERVWPCMESLWALSPSATEEMATLVSAAVVRSETEGARAVGLAPSVVEECLGMCAARSDAKAALLLGRALCGIDDGGLPPQVLAQGTNIRKGAAMLLRAADGGCNAAWTHLHRVHSDHSSSVANAQMARFFLEKAALGGDTSAQRKLGATILKAATGVHESEQGMQWLNAAAVKGDEAARQLLDSFVLQVSGDRDQAEAAIETFQLEDPWLSWRLRLSRDFGLTKLEALSVDPVTGERPWGLVVGPNAFIRKVKLASPRAIPARSDAVLKGLRGAVAFFEQFRAERGLFEGDLRRRSIRVREALTRRGLDEAMFFAQANTTKLDTMRIGSKWAFRHRKPLQSALAT